MAISDTVFKTVQRVLGASSQVVISKPSLGLPIDPRRTSEADTPSKQSLANASGLQSRLFSDAAERRRLALYSEYDEMGDEVPELSQSLEVYKAFTFGGDEHGDNKVKIDFSGSRPIQSVIEQTIANTNVLNNLPMIQEEGERLGDSFHQPIYTRAGDVTKLKWLNPYHTDVHWDGYGNVASYVVRANRGAHGGVPLYPTDVLHFRPNKRMGYKYGRSTWAAARKLWILESTGSDVMSVLTIMRAANRKSVTYPVPAGTDEDGIEKWVNRLKQGQMKQPLFDATGKLQRRIVSLLELDDMIYPYRDGVNAKPPGFHDDPAADLNQLLLVLKHYQERYFVVTGVPAGLAGMERNINDRSTLEQQGLHFVRAIKKRQENLEQFLYELFALSLLARGITPTQNAFEIRMPRVASFDAQMRAATAKIYAETAVILKDMGLPLDFVLKHALNLPKTLVDELVANSDKEVDAVDMQTARERLEAAGITDHAAILAAMYNEVEEAC